ncbi:MAG: UDP-N-acetylglucosamine 1-carboxyvinyltransferase [Anaerolineales bacterium]|nr:UDP-N-acetylglucosamine 1-carboxyvinyltransferase [Anaerolineales bacterium]
MEQLIIHGQQPLRGEVTPSGNKNAALPMLAGCLLTAEPVVLHNVPDIRDVQCMIELLQQLGVSFQALRPHSWRIQASVVDPKDLDPDICRRIRASILLAGPMLARAGKIRLPTPGGDVIGRRRVDTHILALQALGAKVIYQRMFDMQADRLAGADILLDEASVTATENTILAAVLARGKTVLRNAASEPHVQDLCQFLNTLGARIQHIGSNVLKIEGVERLHGGEYTLGADYLEVASFIGAAAVTGGEIRIRNTQPEHLGMTGLVFRRLGVDWQIDGADILVPSSQRMTIEQDLGGAIPEIKTNVWPAFPTDMTSIAITVATQAQGTVLFHDWMFPSRMYFTDKLVSMGARIILCDPHRAIVQGKNELMGENLESPDIRAGMSLILAALAAKGASKIRNISQIDRGYERIDEKLKALGADIQRVAV